MVGKHYKHTTIKGLFFFFFAKSIMFQWRIIYLDEPEQRNCKKKKKEKKRGCPHQINSGIFYLLVLSDLCLTVGKMAVA